MFGQSLILSNVPHQSQEALDKMTPDQLSAYKHSPVLSVQTPYMIIVAIVLVVALLIMLTKFPALQSDDHSDAKQSSFLSSLPDSSVSATGAGRCWRSSATWGANRLLELSDPLRH